MEPERRRPRPPRRRRLPDGAPPAEPGPPEPGAAPPFGTRAGSGSGRAGRVSPMRGLVSTGASDERVVACPASCERGRSAASAAWRPLCPVVTGATERSGRFTPGLGSSGGRPEIGSDIGEIPSRRRASARHGHPPGGGLGAPWRAPDQPARGAVFSNEHQVQRVAFGSRAAMARPAVGEGDEDGRGDERGHRQREEPEAQERRHPDQECTCRRPWSRERALRGRAPLSRPSPRGGNGEAARGA